ncbi:MAG: NUDIX hydrolase [Thermaerobacter sp.]|mgnify:CR=1 FL=1
MSGVPSPGRQAWPAPRPSCHAVVIEDDAVLLVRRAGEPFRGWWGLPGGAVELGETVVEALKREVLEETNLDIEVERFLAYKDAVGRDPETGAIRHHYVIMFFAARRVGGSLRAASDAAEARWVRRDQLPGLRLVPDLPALLASVWPEAVSGGGGAVPGAGPPGP